MKVNPGSNAESKICIACGSTIPASASRCPECSSYQSPMRNRLVYSASISGLIVVLVSLLTYIASTVPDARRAVFWRDEVTVLSFETGDNATVLNSGDGPVYLSRIELSINYKGRTVYAGSVPFEETIKNQSIISLETATIKSISLSEYMESDGEVDIEEHLARSLNREDTCYGISIVSTNDPRYLEVSSFLDDLLIYEDVNASLKFYSLRTGKEKSVELDVVATFVKSLDC